MATVDLDRLPGGELVEPGLEDLAAGRNTVAAAAVAMASERLRAAGLDVPSAEWKETPSHHLYGLLASEDSRGAHSRFNAISRRIASFAAALEHERTR